MTSRRSSGSIRAESAVEPTRSENITVTWRRAARSSGVALGGEDTASPEGSFARKAVMASRSLRRCPTIPTPKSFRSSAVRLGRTVSSISFSRNAASYLSRPRLRSQPLRSITAPHASGTSLSLSEGLTLQREIILPQPRVYRDFERRPPGDFPQIQPQERLAPHL